MPCKEQGSGLIGTEKRYVNIWEVTVKVNYLEREVPPLGFLVQDFLSGVAEVVIGGEHDAGLTTSLDDGLRVAQGHRQRLFAEHILAGGRSGGFGGQESAPPLISVDSGLGRPPSAGGSASGGGG